MNDHVIFRTKDPLLVNLICNDPSIYPYIHGGVEGPLDFTKSVEEEKNIFLATTYGMMMFEKVRPRKYEAHMVVLPEGRGTYALGMAFKCIDWVFKDTNANEIRCRRPYGNVALKALLRQLCAIKVSTIPNGYIKDGKVIPADIYSMTKEHWERMKA